VSGCERRAAIASSRGMSEESYKREIRKLKDKLAEVENEKNVYRAWWKERSAEYSELVKSYETVLDDQAKINRKHYDQTDDIRRLKAEKAEWDKERRELLKQVDLCKVTATVKKLMDDFKSERDGKRARAM